MVRSLLIQQFPKIQIEGAADAENTGNFVVRGNEDGEVLSPYGFLSTTKRQTELLRKIFQKYGEKKK
tara:strand:+ start:218 stop:418 length:201 start_codon:yes stop_codon:yes gene_type:complete